MIFDAGALVKYCWTSTVSLYVQPFSGAFGPAWPDRLENTES